MAKKRGYTKGPARIANKLKTMIKERIKALNLIDTGALYDSIFVYPDNQGGFIIEAEPYYVYLDEGTSRMPAFDITEHVIESKEFQEYIENELLEEVIYEIQDI